MWEVVEQILGNTYEYEKGALDFSCKELEIEVQCGEVYEGNFCIYARKDKYTKGYVSSTDSRMECLTTDFVGREEEIQFRFSAEHLEEGDIITGSFHIVSNQGEYTIPYVVKVLSSYCQSSMGPIQNLSQFANLAKNNWKEAVKLFYTAAFKRMLKAGDNQIYLIYLGLAVREGNEQNVEEFLVAVHKKPQIEFLVSEDKLFLNNPVGMAEWEINILRNGWGYTLLEIDTEGDFLFVEKTTVTEDDFLGNTYKLPVYIDSSYLHAGKNSGSIFIKSTQGTIRVPVEVLISRNSVVHTDKNREHKKMILELMELYQSFRLKRVSSSIWKKETSKLIDRMMTNDEKNVATGLFQVQMLITNERYNEAEESLSQISSMQEDDLQPALEAYFLYLHALLKEDAAYVRDITDRVMKIYDEQGEEWRVAWLLLFLSDEFDRNMVDKWKFLEKQFANGCRSPLIYVEAIQLLNMNPTLLRKMGGFELQVLYYGNKQDVISAELLEQIIYMASRVKEYSTILTALLKGCYSKKPDSRILQEICIQLIKGNRTDKQCFEWFSKGIDEELRITNLYEYYMLSLDIQQEIEIPKRVLLYFTYQSNLDYRHFAYLYYYVTKNREQFPDIYDIYCKRIERFIVEQICKLHVNTHLAFLYNAFLREDMVDAAVAQALSYLLFAYEIRVKQEGIRNVIVFQPENSSEMVYPVINGEVWVPLYGNDSVVLFEDLQGQRFINSVSYTIEHLALSDALLEKVALLTENNPAMDLYLYQNHQEKENLEETDLNRYYRILDNSFVSQKIKRELLLKIAGYYERANEKQRLAEYLETVFKEQLTVTEGVALIPYMIQNGQYDMAYEWLNYFGDSKMDYKSLLRLLEVIIEQRAYTYDKELVGFSYRLFRKGSLNSTLLTYLMKHYQGLSKDFGRIWNASKSYSMNKKDFCERVLVQILFSNTQIEPQEEIFKEYIYAGADRNIEDAYLKKNCYDFFVKEEKITGDVLTEIGRLHSMEGDVRKICKLAYLKYYAENRQELQETDVPIIRDFLSDMLKEGIRLNCFQTLRQYCGNQLLLQDKTIVEYRAGQECTVKIHYRILQEGNVDSVQEYQSERMDSVLGRIFYKEFVLFFGESLQYYITEDADGNEMVTENVICHRNNSQDDEQGGRYGLINAIAHSKIMKDYHTFDLLTEDYYKKEFLNQALFHPKH